MPVLLRYKDQDIIDGLDQTINPSLYGHYSASFRRAVDVTFKQDSDSGLSDRLRANAARFAAHKAAYVQRTLQNIQADPQIEDKPKACKQALRVFDNWQDAEYNTAVARARTAKQFEEFNDPESLRLFPNLRWVPSRSANPRAAHQVFYDRVWAKNDPFWANHSPGTEWNCKCDIEETDAPVTENQDMQLPKAPRGLEGNPAETGELFTDNASYVAKTNESSLERYIGNKILRQESIQQLKTQQGNNISMDKRGEEIEVIMDSKTTAHLSNDVARTTGYYWNEIIGKLPSILKKCPCVAHERNGKLLQKPSAVEYFYYEYETKYGKFYISVEENFVVKENRHFYRLYAISKTLRPTAILY